MNLSIEAWGTFLGVLLTESLLLAFVAWALLAAMNHAVWRRLVCQGLVIGLAFALVAESAGYGRGFASWVMGNLGEAEQIAPAAFEVTSTVPNEIQGTHASRRHDFLERPDTLFPHFYWPAWIWGAGTLLLLLRIGLAHCAIRRIVRRRSLSVDTVRCSGKILIVPGDPGERSELAWRVGRLARLMGLKCSCRVVEILGLRAPAAMGWLHPTIAVPMGFQESASAGDQEIMLVHELAHLAAKDPLWRLSVDLLCAAWWWNPVVWWARQRWHHACEEAADEASLVLENGPERLAECLVRAGGDLMGDRTSQQGGLGVTGWRSGLGKRVDRLMKLPSGSANWPLTGFSKRLISGGTGLAFVLMGTLCFAQALQPVSGRGSSLDGLWRKSWARGMLIAFQASPEEKAQLRDFSSSAFAAENGSENPPTNSGIESTTSIMIEAFWVEGPPNGAQSKGLQQIEGLLRSKFGESVGIVTNPPLEATTLEIHTTPQGARATNEVGLPGTKPFAARLDAEQFQAVKEGLKQQPGFELLSAPSLVTRSGRQARVQAVQARTIVTGVQTNLEQSVTPPEPRANFLTTNIMVGPSLDVTPVLTPDNRSIELILLGELFEFVGYDDPGTNSIQFKDPEGEILLTAELPLPRFQIRKFQNRGILGDGEAIILGGLMGKETVVYKSKVPILGDVPLLGRLFRRETKEVRYRELLLGIKASVGE